MFAPKVPKPKVPIGVSSARDPELHRPVRPSGSRAQGQFLWQALRASRSADPPKRTGERHSTIRTIAERGIKGSGGRLPFLDIIQRAFGHHDVSTVVAHSDGRAKAACDAVGAAAFATGNHVAFQAAPSLHTAAHEAAHVVQQRAGVQLRGGMGESGDSYERQADRVADLVARGESAAAMLDGPGTGLAGSGRVESDGASVQRQEVESGEPESAEAEVAEPESPETDVAEPASPAVESASEDDQTVSDAPAAEYIVPFDRSPLAAPGERIIFRAQFTDTTPTDYQLEYSTTGGHFTSASGPTSRTIAGLRSGNVDFFVPTPWTGTTAVQVVLRVRKIADNSVAQTETWNFGIKTRYPTTITQEQDGSERALPGVYSYVLGPAVAGATAPYYHHHTILEFFGNWTLANIVVADIAPAYRTTHGLTTDSAVSAHFLSAYAGLNGTFTVNANDRIGDRHGGHPDLSNLVSHLVAPKAVEVALPQIYEARPGTTLGSYMITRILRADGTTWRIRKARGP